MPDRLGSIGVGPLSRFRRSAAGRIGDPPVVLVAASGVQGGVDQGARHLFGDPDVRERCRAELIDTRGLRVWAAPAVFVRALVRVGLGGLTGRVDLLHLNVSHRGSTLRKLMMGNLARMVGLPYVVQVHTGRYQEFHRALPGWAARVVAHFFARADHVLVLGQAFLPLVRDDLGVPPDRISVIPNAVSWRPETKGRHDHVPTIVFTGRLGPGKAPEVLIEALGRLRDRPWRAILVGDGDVAGYGAMADALDLSGRVEVRGWQPRSAIDDLLQASAIFVQPSRSEGLSISLLEAMAAGLGCVATPVGAHGEVVDDGVNGLLVDPGDVEGLAMALARLLDDPDLRERLGSEARRTFEARFTPHAVGARLLEVYDAVLAARRS